MITNAEDYARYYQKLLDDEYEVKYIKETNEFEITGIFNFTLKTIYKPFEEVEFIVRDKISDTNRDDWFDTLNKEISKTYENLPTFEQLKFKDLEMSDPIYLNNNDKMIVENGIAYLKAIDFSNIEHEHYRPETSTFWSCLNKLMMFPTGYTKFLILNKIGAERIVTNANKYLDNIDELRSFGSSMNNYGIIERFIDNFSQYLTDDETVNINKKIKHCLEICLVKTCLKKGY